MKIRMFMIFHKDAGICFSQIRTGERMRIFHQINPNGVVYRSGYINLNIRRLEKL